MDSSRFDSLARSLTDLSARNPSRRNLLQVLGGGLLAIVLGGAPDATAKKRRKPKCRGTRANFTFCRGIGCRDLQNDPANCGLCARACDANQTCESGQCAGGLAPCVPDCDGAVCGADDGCGGKCSRGSCPAGQTCGGDGEQNICGTGCIPSCGGKQCGSDGCNGSCGVCPTGQICRDNGTCVAGGGGGCNSECPYNYVCQNGTCVVAPNRCPSAFVCRGFGGEAPKCGRVAGNPGGTCGCYSSTEGNSVCLNETDADGDPVITEDLVTCNSSQQCRNTVGPHFYCRKPLFNENGLACGQSIGRCWPECDSPTVAFSNRQAKGRSRRKRARRK
jgi:hypothetical protein